MLPFLVGAAAFAAVALVAALRPRRLSSSPALVAVLAAVAGAIAATEPGTATGVGWYDAVLRAVGVAAVAWLGSRAPLAVLAVAGVVLGAWSGIPAAAAAGLAIGALAVRLDGAGLRALVAAGVALGAFHLDGPWSVPVGAGVLLIVAVAGLPRRRASVLAVGALLLVVGAAAAGGAFSALAAENDMAQGVAAVRRGLSAAQAGETDAAAQSLDQAGASFARGRSRLAVWWARPAAAVPWVGLHRRAAVVVADSGAQVATVGAGLARASDPSALAVRQGTIDVAALQALGTAAGRAAEVVDAAVVRLRAVDSPLLIEPVADRLADVQARMGRAGDTAAKLAAGSRLAAPMLGADGPRRYFLALQTPSEGRGAGGFLGSFAELAADRGRLSLERVGRTADLNRGPPRQLSAPDDYRARYGRFDPHVLWQNVNMSPDFPTVVGVVADLYPQSGGRPVDGVIAIDPYGLAAVLKAVGPVTAAAWPVPITADNVVPILLHEQYLRFARTDRIDFLADVTEVVWRRLTGGSSGVLELGRALGAAVDEKHVMLGATRPEEQAALVNLAVAGGMAPVADDFVAVVTQNASGNKIDWFLRRSLDYRVVIDPGRGDLAAVARVTLANQAPAGGLPAYVIGNAVEPPLATGFNRTYVSIYSPWGLAGATIDGRPASLESHVELGRNVYSAYVDVAPGASVVIEARLEGRRAVDARPYVLDLHRQPVVGPDAVQVMVDAADGWMLCDAGVDGRDDDCRRRAQASVALLRDSRLSWQATKG